LRRYNIRFKYLDFFHDQWQFFGGGVMTATAVTTKDFFGIKARESTVYREVIAGISTYLSLAYIFVVNPAILSGTHMNVSAVLFATAVASGLATLAMGLWAKLPFAVAPGLEMNGFFAFVVVGTLGLSWQDALATVFWSGVLCVLLTILPFRQRIIDSIPDGLKINIGVSVGVFVATIGLSLAKIVAFKDGLPDLAQLSVGALATHGAVITYITFAVAFILGLKVFRFPGGMLAAIIVGTLLCHYFGISADHPAQLSSDMFLAMGQAHIFSVIANPHFLPVMLVFFIVDFYGGIGKFIGLTAATNIQSNGKVPNIGRALYVDGFGTIGGSLLGTSSLITFVESAVGIAAGGRTGLTAIVCGLLMLLSLVFTPLVGLVPTAATAGVLLYVGWLLLPIRQLRESPELFGGFDVLIAVIMGVLSFITFGLDKALLAGFLFYTGREILRRRFDPFLITTTLVLAGSVVVQYAKLL
jgi:AGZA family xanthine/uracil permease-like MFS transporter